MRENVARYYDENTRRFLARGQGARTGVIHRAAWGEGVTKREEAFHYVHDLILGEVELVRAERILDLGCGIGASLAYIVARCGARAFGITNSALQAKLAPSQLDIVHGDFETDPLPSPVDLAYAIESFVHASEPVGFLDNVATAIRPGGRLVIVDDFLAGEQRDGYWARTFIDGWHAESLSTPDEMDARAAERGLVLVSDRDLTPFLEIDRSRDRAIRLVAAMGRLLRLEGARFQALSGGDALRQCLKRGIVTYRFRVFEKREIS